MRIKPFFLPVLLAGAATSALAEAPIVLSVSRDYQTILDAPATVQVITRAEIAAMNYRDLAEVLRAQVGFMVSKTHGTSASVRGSSTMGDANTRLLVLYDNHPLTELEFSSNPIALFDPEHGFGIDISKIRQIEIIRGPGFQLYGSSAMLAVINIIPETVESGVGASIGGGSLGRESYAAHASVARDAFKLSLQYFGNQMAGDDFVYQIPDLENGGEPETVRADGLSKAGQNSGLLNLDVGKFRLTAFASQTLQKDGSGMWLTIPGMPQPNNNARAFVRLRYQDEIGSNLRVYTRISWDGYQYRGRFFYEPEVEGDPLFYERDHSKTQWATAEVQLDWAAPGEQLITVGVQGQSQYMLYQENAAPLEGGTYFRDERDQSVVNAFIQDEWTPVSWMTLNGVIRYENHSTFGDFWGPRASALFRLGDTSSLKANYGHGFRAPNVYELYYGDGFLYFGNEDLDPEVIDSFELTHDWAGEKHRLQTSVFFSRMKDLIAQVDGTKVLDGEEIETRTFDNLTQADSYGAEAAWRFDGEGGRMMELSASYQRNKEKDSGEDSIPDSPHYKFALRTIQPLGDGGATLGWETWWLSRRLNYDGSSVDPLTLTSLSLRYAPPERAFSFVASANNLFDKRYDNPASTSHPEVVIPQSGRTLFIQGSVAF